MRSEPARKSLWLLISAALLALCVTLILGANRGQKAAFHARARFKLEAGGTGYLPTFYQDQITIVSNLLNTPGNRSILATTSKIDEKSFALEMVGPVRSTSFLYVSYSGTESNCVRSVASNAAALVISFYATNQPSWEVTFLDSEYFRPESPWERLQNSVASFWQRSKAAVGW